VWRPSRDADQFRAGATDLYRTYKAHCEASGEEPLTQTAFGLRLGERGLVNRRDSATGRKFWYGVRLRP
jgi:hypothetical protein